MGELFVIIKVDLGSINKCSLKKNSRTLYFLENLFDNPKPKKIIPKKINIK